MRSLQRHRVRQLEHAGMAMARDLKPDDDLHEIYAVLMNTLVTHELKQPFPDWRRVRQLALKLAESCDA